ncbi:MAG TPA: autotransporter-associated beta strand repeat-containing protein, partial [bacterium]|nr:autotransporter-associated beta strand repeat-containing protein [bacterium]
YTGVTTVAAGSLIIGGGGAIPDGSTLSIHDNATLDLAGYSDTVGALSGAGTIQLGSGGQLVMQIGEEVSTFSGVITGDGGVEVSGNGIQVLSGANTYAGPTLINEGALTLGADGTLPSSGAVDIAGGMLDMHTYNNTVGAVTLRGGAKIYDYYSYYGYGGTLTAESFDVQDGQIQAVISGGPLTKNDSGEEGGGTVEIDIPATYSGGTTVNAGKLALSTNWGFYNDMLPAGEDVTVNGGVLDLGGVTQSVGTLTLADGEIIDESGGGAISADAFDVRKGLISANLEGDGALVKTTDDNVTLTGNNSYTGGTTVSGGTLTGNGASLQGSITNNALVVFDEDDNREYVGSMSGSGSVIKANNGTITFSGANTYAGTTSIDSGTLILTGSSASDMLVNDEGKLMGAGMTSGDLVVVGTVVPGTPGVNLGIGALTVGDATFAGNGSLVVKFRDVSGVAGTGWDEIIVTGENGLDITATSGSTFSVALVTLDASGNPGDCDGFDNTVSHSYNIVTTANGIAGFVADKFSLYPAQFTNDLGGGYFTLGQSDKNMVLEFNAVPEPSAFALFMLAVPAVFAASRIRRKRSGSDLTKT